MFAGALKILTSIEKTGKGMNPSDVIQLIQRVVMLVGNAHFL
jgi:hypothetical protein